MDFVDLVLSCLISASVFLSVVFMIAHQYKRYDLIDSAWGLTFIVIALVAATLTPAFSTVEGIVVTIVGIWGIRLAWHIFSRWLRSSGEDPRYVELRKGWSSNRRGLQIFIRIYMTQALLATAVSLPVLVVSYVTPPLSTVTAIGVLIWCVGFTFETVADFQLRRFLHSASRGGGLMTQGLWRYSRHPNYFGEIVQWWGIGVIAFSSSLWWVAIIGPVAITTLICFISGIPPAERRAQMRQGWEQYRRSTSVLIPWFKH